MVTVHGLDFKRAKWGGVASAVLRAGAWTAGKCPNRTIVVSKLLRNHYKIHYGVDTVHIPNGVEKPVSRELDALRRFGLEPGGYILSLGRLVPEKGLHTLIEAHKSLDTDLKLVIAGGTSHTADYVDSLKRLARGDDRIIFTGPLYGEEKDEAFSNARLFAMPSELEGMPIAMLEAMSYGVPVVVSDIAECTEVCRVPELAMAGGQESVATFPVSSVAGLASAIRGALADPLLKEKGLRARDYALEVYDWDRITDQTLSVYEEILSEPRPVGASPTAQQG